MENNLQTITIKGKEYVQVNERLKEFRTNPKYEGYSLETFLENLSPTSVLFKAVIKDPSGRVVATGYAYEEKSDDYKNVNSTNHIENAETSSWGRALGNLGIGINVSVASADEVDNAIKRQEKLQRKVETQDKPQEKIWWSGEGNIKLYEPFMVDDLEYIRLYAKTEKILDSENDNNKL